ncbi:MAG: 30S ribosomal protein S8 [Weeksellaceae bacterium]
MAITDLIIRIKNGYMARKDQIDAPLSKYRVSVLQKLKALGYIQDFQKDEENRLITIDLKYERGVPAMTDVKLFSTSGRRWYTPYKDVKPVLNGMGYAIISTSKGIMTNKEAQKLKVGGELLFHVW